MLAKLFYTSGKFMPWSIEEDMELMHYCKKTAAEPVCSKYFANGSEKHVSRGKNRCHGYKF